MPSLQTDDRENSNERPQGLLKIVLICSLGLAIWVLILLLPQIAWTAQPRINARVPAQTTSQTSGHSDVDIYPMDSGWSPKAFGETNYNIHSPSEADGREMPAPKEREKLFAEVGLTPLIAEFDSLDRDLLYLRAKDRPLNELRELYPTLPPEPLVRLQTWIRGRPR